MNHQITGRRHTAGNGPNLNQKLVSMAVAAAALMTGATAGAMELDAGSDWSVRWDNTVRYNLITRVADQDSEVVSSALADDSNLNFDKGDIVSNRLDLLSEFDVIWRDSLGFRISAAAWYDHAYSDRGDYRGNTEIHPMGVPLNTWGSLSVGFGEYTDATEKYHYRGGELLDAFAFYSFDTDSMSGNIRAGRHTLYWGNSLGVSGAINGIGGAMAPMDLGKASSVPGTEAQELFMPTEKVSTVIQLTNNLTLGAYWSLDYEQNRLAQTGSYFSASEIGNAKSEFAVLAPGVIGAPAPASFRSGLVKSKDAEPDGEDEYGISLQYYSQDLNADIGLVYLNYNDKGATMPVGRVLIPPPPASPMTPQAYAALVGMGLETPTFIPPDALALGEFKWVYKNDIELYGLTFNRPIGDWSMGLDFVYRKDAALRNNALATLTYYNAQNFPTPPNEQQQALIQQQSQAAAQATLQAALDGGATLQQAQILAQQAAQQTALQLGTAIATVNSDAAAGAAFASAGPDNYIGAVGDVASVTFNGNYLLNGTALWDAGSIGFEIVTSWLDKVTENEAFLDPVIQEGRVFTGIFLSFKPRYYQVFDSTDLDVPITVNYGIDGNSPLPQGGDQELGTASIGLEFTYKESWLFSAKYNAYFGPVKAGGSGLLKDRDNIALTIKRTF